MSAEPKRRLSAEDYLVLERTSDVKHEYLDGEMFAMAGTSWAHSQVVFNLGAALRPQLRERGCRAGSELRVHVPATGLYTYPDLVVLCGEPRFVDDAFDTLENPTVVVEVLSPSTASYDRGEKFVHYRSLPSLGEYLMLAQDRPHAEVYVRQRDGWYLTELDGLDAVLELPSIGCRVPLREVFEDVVGR